MIGMARPVAMRYSAQSNTRQNGAAPGGTMGGRPAAAGKRKPGSRPVAIGDEVYLWILVLIEVLLIGVLRKQFKRHHGG